MHLESLKFLDPELDPQVRICRYVSFSKFVDLLETGTLFLPFAIQMSDQFEGLPYHNEDVLEMVSKARQVEAKVLSEENAHARWGSAFTGLSCWTKFDEAECYLMWRAYTNTLDGIAIVTTVERLLASLEDCGTPIYLARVLYQPDEVHEQLPNGSISAYFRKRAIYEREQEIRLVARLLEMDDQMLSKKSRLVRQALDDEGISLPVELETLIEEVIVAPDVPIRLLRLVESLCKRAGVGVEFKRSQLSQRPILYDADRGTVNINDRSLEMEFNLERRRH